jgi:peptide/nickel transport system substrate-binding protein
MEDLAKKGDFDMALVGRGVLFTPDPDEIMMTDYHSSGTSTTAYGANRWSNTRVDELIEKARTIDDPASRKVMYDEVQSIVVDECPVLYLNYYVNLDVMTNKIQGYRSHPNEYSYHLEQVKFV